MKRVLLLVVDGCTSRLMQPALERGELPALDSLRARGTLRFDCFSIFPSITPAATASIVTGRYPQDHGIAGMSWWNPADGRVSYFGDDVWTVLQRGVATFLRDFMLQLNDERLRAPTLYQTAERNGRSAGCLNFLIFRGDIVHVVHMPLLLRLWPSTPRSVRVRGPSMLCLGEFVCQRPAGPAPEAHGTVFDRYGLDDESTARLLLDLPGAYALPDFTVAYFADYDFDSHERGPDAALETLRRFDGRLGAILDAWGGVDRVLDEACIILTADHSHSAIGRGDRAGIILSELLEGFETADPADGWHNSDELMLCPNMRAAEIYFHKSSRNTADRVREALLEDERVDQVIWRDPGDPDGELHVATRDRGLLRFVAAQNEWDAEDDFGGRWRIRGELAALDAGVDHGRIRYGTYPNACERIASGLERPEAGQLWVTARPGHEFEMAGQSVHHRGGSHGTLHELDSLVPLLVAGAPPSVHVPPRTRIVDVEPLCRQALDLPEGMAPGASHSRPAGGRHA